jgi:hypothetical protein
MCAVMDESLKLILEVLDALKLRKEHHDKQ